MTSSLGSDLKGRQVIADPVEPGVPANDGLKGDRNRVLADGSLMGSKPLSFSGIEHHHEVASTVSENTRPGLLHRPVQPHEFVFSPTLDLAVVFGIQRLELVLQRLGRLLAGDENDAERALSTETDILGAFVVELRD